MIDYKNVAGCEDMIQGQHSHTHTVTVKLFPSSRYDISPGDTTFERTLLYHLFLPDRPKIKP